VRTQFRQGHQFQFRARPAREPLFPGKPHSPLVVLGDGAHPGQDGGGIRRHTGKVSLFAQSEPLVVPNPQSPVRVFEKGAHQLAIERFRRNDGRVVSLDMNEALARHGGNHFPIVRAQQ